jgi:YihY family inner membrane protein
MARTSWTEHHRVVDVRRRAPILNAVVRAIHRYTLHRTGRNAALVSHYAFLSVFPLLLVFTTVLGFVLEGNQTLQDQIIDSVFSHIPIIGPELAKNPDSLTGSVPVLIAGLVTALWASLKAFNVLQTALDDIGDVAIDARPNVLVVRGRSLLGILIVGGGQVTAAVLAGFLGVSGVGWIYRVLLATGTLALNTTVLALTYRFLCTRRPSWRRVAPGAIVGGVLFSGLQVVGTTVVARAIARATPIYGTFALVIGLITWLGLHSMILLLGAELNGVLPLRPYEEREIPQDPM